MDGSFQHLEGGGGLSAVVCKESLLDVIKLESGGKAYVSATMFGMRSEGAGAYTVDGDRVNVVINGESTVLTLAGKTLDGGG